MGVAIDCSDQRLAESGCRLGQIVMRAGELQPARTAAAGASIVAARAEHVPIAGEHAAGDATVPSCLLQRGHAGFGHLPRDPVVGSGPGQGQDRDPVLATDLDSTRECVMHVGSEVQTRVKRASRAIASGSPTNLLYSANGVRRPSMALVSQPAA